MATVGITYSTGVRSTIGILQLDALISEGTELAARASEYPVEDGSPITDHVTVENERLKLSGLITPSDVMLMTADGRTRLMEAKATLRKLVSDRQPMTVSTGMDNYTDMVLVSCNIGRSNEGDHLTVDAELIKIRRVTLRQVDIPPDRTSGTATGKAGSTKTKAGKSDGNEPKPKEVSKLRKLTTSTVGGGA